MNKARTFILICVFYPLAGTGEALPDPTKPPDYSVGTVVVQQQKKDVEFNLTAIRIDKEDRSAIINGRLLREGEQVDSAKLLEIHPAHVVLNHENQRLVVRLYESLGRKPSESEQRTETTH